MVKTMPDLTFDIWQFVRLMVQLEGPAKENKGQGSLFETWRDIWESVDRDLTGLYETDFDAYANMMMNETITIAEVSPSHAGEAVEALRSLITTIDDAIKAGKKEPEPDMDLIDNLTFERGELNELCEKLRELA